MYVDAQNLFCSAQAVTASAASTNLIDFSIARDMGNGEDIYLVVNITVAMTDSGSDSTVAVTLETDDNASFSSAATAMTIGTFAATSAAGTQLFAKLQPGKIDEQYLRAYFTVAGGNLTTGSFDAFLTTDIQNTTDYASGYTVS